MENREMSGLEALKEMRKYGAVMIPNCEIIEKELEVLQTIKKHIGVIRGYIYTTDSQITDSEYELLCEVLRCDS